MAVFDRVWRRVWWARVIVRVARVLHLRRRLYRHHGDGLR